VSKTKLAKRREQIELCRIATERFRLMKMNGVAPISIEELDALEWATDLAERAINTTVQQRARGRSGAFA
jgi:hypothetical protein